MNFRGAAQDRSTGPPNRIFSVCNLLGRERCFQPGFIPRRSFWVSFGPLVVRLYEVSFCRAWFLMIVMHFWRAAQERWTGSTNSPAVTIFSTDGGALDNVFYSGVVSRAGLVACYSLHFPWWTWARALLVPIFWVMAFEVIPVPEHGFLPPFSCNYVRVTPIAYRFSLERLPLADMSQL